MARNDQVTRILKTISLLERQPAGYSVTEIQKKLQDDGFKCSTRSVYRDLEAIERAHFPVTRDGSGDTSRWRLNSIAALSPNIRISYRELLALFVARNSLSAMRGSPIHEAIESFFDRVEKVLGPRAQEGLTDLQGYIGFKARPQWHTAVSQEIIDTLHSACDEGHMLEVDYRAASGENKGEVKPRILGPEQIFFGDSGLYLIATEIKTGQLKLYSVSRMTSAKLLADTYERHGEGVDELMSHGIGVLSLGDTQEVIIEVADPLAAYVSERRWNDTQSVVRHADGIVLKMNVKVNDELVRWVLGLGASARVMAPEGLREMVLGAVDGIAGVYRRAG